MLVIGAFEYSLPGEGWGAYCFQGRDSAGRLSIHFSRHRLRSGGEGVIESPQFAKISLDREIDETSGHYEEFPLMVQYSHL